MSTRLVIAFVILCAMCTAASARILIATAAPMTGDRAWTGEQSRWGGELAVADVNAAGGLLGQQVALMVGDDAGDPHQAAALAQKLVSDGVVLVVGHRASDASIVASRFYHAANVIQISPASTNPALTEQGFANVFRVCGRDDDQGTVAAEYLAEQLGKRIGIVHDGSVYGQGLAERTREALHARDVQEVHFGTYQPGAKDYSDLIASLAQQRVEILYVGGYSPEAGLIMQQAHDLGYRFQMVAGDTLNNADFWMIAGEAGHGALFTFGSDPRESPHAREVVHRFRDSGYEPAGYTLHTYAAVQIWAQAVRIAGSVDADKVIAVLRSHEFQSVLGPVRFDDKGDLRQHHFVWYRWTDGRYVRYP